MKTITDIVGNRASVQTNSHPVALLNSGLTGLSDKQWFEAFRLTIRPGNEHGYDLYFLLRKVLYRPVA